VKGKKQLKREVRPTNTVLDADMVGSASGKKRGNSQDQAMGNNGANDVSKCALLLMFSHSLYRSWTLFPEEKPQMRNIEER
jgi:hypothetical protein